MYASNLNSIDWTNKNKLRTWISGRDGRIRPQNLEIPSKNPAREKSQFSHKFLLLWNETQFPKKFATSHVKPDNFLASVGNFLLPLEGQELNAVQGI